MRHLLDGQRRIKKNTSCNIYKNPEKALDHARRTEEMEILVDEHGYCRFAKDLSEWARKFHDGRNYGVNVAGNSVFQTPRDPIPSTWITSITLDHKNFHVSAESDDNDDNERDYDIEAILVDSDDEIIME